MFTQSQPSNNISQKRLALPNTFRERMTSFLSTLPTNNTQVVKANTIAFSWAFKAESYSIVYSLFDLVRHLPKYETVAQSIKPPRPYVGVHLRQEVDARNYTPMNEYVNRTLKALKVVPGIRTLYVATGDQGKLKEFTQKMTGHGYTIVEKGQFLNSSLYADWHFDYRAMLDVAPLVNSDFFIGHGWSSMSWVVSREREMRDVKSVFVQGPLNEFLCCF